MLDRETLDKWSAPYRGWHYYSDYIIPPKPEIEGYEDVFAVDVPTVFKIPGDDKWYMSFIGFNGQGYQSFAAKSDDLVHWKQLGLAMGFGPEREFDHGGCVLGAYLYESYDIRAPRVLKKRDGKFWSLYGSYPKQGGYELRPGYEGVAMSDSGLNWKRAKDKYILSIYDEDCGKWEKDCIYQPWLLEYDGKFWNFYNAANDCVEQIGLAFSDNLLDWTRYTGNPIVCNAAEGYNTIFTSDPKVFRDGDHWVMFFFGVNPTGAYIMIAFSTDLVHWAVHPEPLYKPGEHPRGLDSRYSCKVSVIYDNESDTFYMFYCAVDIEDNRGITLLTSRPLSSR